MKPQTKVKLIGNAYPVDKYNPKGISGTVIGLNKRKGRGLSIKEDGKFNPIIVEWDNGYRNSYKESQLEII